MANADFTLRSSDFRSEVHTVVRDMTSAGWAVIEELSEIGEAAIREAMPSGSYASSHHHHDAERPPLQENLQSEHAGYHLDIWIDSVNAMSLDQGSAPHEIHGNPQLRFFWEKAGVPFRGPMVNHPGTDAHHFMQAGFDAMDAAAEEILDKYYL
jgi:hypothetical protein